MTHHMAGNKFHEARSRGELARRHSIWSTVATFARSFVLMLAIGVISGCTGTSETTSPVGVPAAAEKTVPITVKTVEPRDYLGTWEGTLVLWIGVQPLRIVVEAVQGTRAIVTFFWGNATGGLQGREACVLRTWKVLPDGRLEWTYSGVTYWLRLTENDAVAELKRVWNKNQWTTYARMARVRRPPASESTVQAWTQAATDMCWTDYFPRLEAGESASPVRASFPWDLEITPPATDLPVARAAWSGTWHGYAGNDRRHDAKLAVERVTPDGALIVHSLASRNTYFMTRRVQAKFLGDDLRAVVGPGWRIDYRMRADGNIVFQWILGADWLRGILSKHG